MDIFSDAVFAAALSIDALGIGVSCALRGIRLSLRARIVVFAVCTAVTGAAVFFGGMIKGLLPWFPGEIVGALLLAALGVYIIIGAFGKEDAADVQKNRRGLIKSTAEILTHPDTCDADNSKALDLREALFLGAALSADCFAAGIGSGVGGSSVLVPFFCGGFQLLFLCAGEVSGRIAGRKFESHRGWLTAASGLMLIGVAAFKLIIEN